jgi:catechol 2,3-dioxygenase
MTAWRGRIHLRVKNLDRAVRFYTRVLGLRVAAREPGMALLEVADSRQQIALHADGTDRVAPPLSLGCQFIGFEVPSTRHLAALCERLGGARATIVNAGDSWSLQTTDPDGNGIEIYCATGAMDPEGVARPARTMSLADLQTAAQAEAVG